MAGDLLLLILSAGTLGMVVSIIGQTLTAHLEMILNRGFSAVFFLPRKSLLRYRIVCCGPAAVAMVVMAGAGQPLGALQSPWPFCAVLWVIAEIDLRTRLIPDFLSLPLWIAGAMWRIGGPIPGEWLSLCAALIVPGGAAALVNVLARSRTPKGAPAGFGWGDVKLLAGMGCWLGAVPTLEIWVIGSAGLLFFGLVAGRRGPVAFAPALLGATMLRMVWPTVQSQAFGW